MRDVLYNMLKYKFLCDNFLVNYYFFLIKYMYIGYVV